MAVPCNRKHDMATAILITEDVSGTPGVIVHQLHASLATAVATIKESHSNCKNVKFTMGEWVKFGSNMRQPIRVTYMDDAGKLVKNDYLLTEMFVYDFVDHL